MRETIPTGRTDLYQEISSESTLVEAYRVRRNRIREQYKRLKSQRLSAMRDAFAGLKALYTENVAYWQKQPLLHPQWVKPVKRRVQDGWRKIRRVRVHKKRFLVRDKRTGKAYLRTERTPVPHITEVPNWKYVVVRDGFFRMFHRVKVMRQRINWEKLWPEYRAAKARILAETSPQYTALKEQLAALNTSLHREFHRSHAARGCCPKGWTFGHYAAFKPYRIPKDPRPELRNLLSKSGYVLALDDVTDGKQVPWVRTDAQSGAQTTFYHRTGGMILLGATVHTLGFNTASGRDAYMRVFSQPQDEGEYDSTAHIPTTPVLGSTKLVDKGNDTIDLQKENLAYAQVAAFRGSADYAFNYFRSLGELKDLPATVDQARDFFRFLGSPSNLAIGGFRSRVRAFAKVGMRGSQAIASAYLAWKFAIQPTIQDAETLLTNTTSWIFQLRKTLEATYSTLKAQKERVYHARKTWRGDGQTSNPDQESVPIPDEWKNKQLDIRCVYTLDLQPAVYADRTSLDVVKYDGSQWFTSLDPQTICTTSNVEPMVARRRGVPYSWMGEFLQKESVTVPGYLNADYVLRDFRLTNRNPHLDQLFDGYDLRPRVSISGDANRYPQNFGPHGLSHYSLPELDGHASWTVRPPDDSFTIPVVAGPANIEPYYADRVVKNWIRGVVFAHYRNESILDVLGLTGDLDFTNIRTRLDEIRTSLISRLDVMSTTWELAPLSFVYDWFTTSQLIVRRLSALATGDVTSGAVPDPIDGFHAMRHYQLLAGIPEYSDGALELHKRYRVSQWGTIDIGDTSPISSDGPVTVPYRYWCTPKLIELEYLCRWRRPVEAIRLSRTGVHKFERGRFTADHGPEAFLPQIQLKLDASKIVTLLAMAVSSLR